MKKIILNISIFHLFILVHSPDGFSQVTKKPAPQMENVSRSPKLVVGIVIDQMRYDYLYRYASHYSAGGFKRLMSEGFSCNNANYNYVPTATGPGHSAVYSGTTPAWNGIISNEWFDRSSGKYMYCVSDSTVTSVGATGKSGKMSPRNLLCSTITDEVRLASNFRSKVIGIALKDRGSILPAGHSANAAYWHDPATNNWISSSYYMRELPEWVQAFNRRHLADTLLSKPWELLLKPDQYSESAGDDNLFEGLYKGEVKPVFPHNLPLIKAQDSELIRRTPFGNTFTELFAEATVRGENLGKGKFTDFLAVSFSSTDYVGHMFGLQAVETEDTYLRMDLELSRFLSFLDSWVGKNNYLLFLTADHGAAGNPDFMESNHIPGGLFNESGIADSLQRFLEKQIGPGNFILSANSLGVYLDHQSIREKKYNESEVETACANYMLQYDGIATVMTRTELSRGLERTGLLELVQNGFNQKRSPDITYQANAGWVDWSSHTGTSHGTYYRYDTHVPLLFFGNGIRHGKTSSRVVIPDIAATIAMMLHIEFPSACTGKPITSVLKK